MAPSQGFSYLDRTVSGYKSRCKACVIADFVKIICITIEKGNLVTGTLFSSSAISVGFGYRIHFSKGLLSIHVEVLKNIISIFHYLYIIRNLLPVM